MEIKNQKVISLGIILALLIIIDLFFIYYIFIAETITLDEKQTFDFGSALIEKQTFISDKQHYEIFNLMASDFSNISLLVIVPKNLATKADDISIKTYLGFELFDDSVLKFEQKKNSKEFSARIDYENKSEGYCSYAIILPKKYLQELTKEKETLLKDKLNKYSKQQNDCLKVQEINKNLAEEFAKIFTEEKFAEENFSNEKIILFDANSDRFIDALDAGIKKSAKGTGQTSGAENASSNGILPAEIFTLQKFNPLDNKKLDIFITANADIKNALLKMVPEYAEETAIPLVIRDLSGNQVTSLEKWKKYSAEWDGRNGTELATAGIYYPRIYDMQVIIPSNAFTKIDYMLKTPEFEPTTLDYLGAPEFALINLQIYKNRLKSSGKTVISIYGEKLFDDIDALGLPKFEISGIDDSLKSKMKVKAEMTYKIYPYGVQMGILKKTFSEQEISVLKKLAKHNDFGNSETFYARAESEFQKELNEEEKIALKGLLENKIIYLGYPHVIFADLDFSGLDLDGINFPQSGNITLDYGIYGKKDIKFGIYKYPFEIITDLSDESFKNGCLSGYKDITELSEKEIENSLLKFLRNIERYPDGFWDNYLEKLVLFNSPTVEYKMNEKKKIPSPIESEDCINEGKYRGIVYLDTNGLLNSEFYNSTIDGILTHKLYHSLREHYVAKEYPAEYYFDTDNILLDSYENPYLIGPDAEKAKDELKEYLSKKCKNYIDKFFSLAKPERIAFVNENCDKKAFDEFARSRHLLEKIWSNSKNNVELEEGFATYAEMIENYSENLSKADDEFRKKLAYFKEILRRASKNQINDDWWASMYSSSNNAATEPNDLVRIINLSMFDKSRNSLEVTFSIKENVEVIAIMAYANAPKNWENLSKNMKTEWRLPKPYKVIYDTENEKGSVEVDSDEIDAILKKGTHTKKVKYWPESEGSLICVIAIVKNIRQVNCRYLETSITDFFTIITDDIYDFFEYLPIYYDAIKVPELLTITLDKDKIFEVSNPNSLIKLGANNEPFLVPLKQKLLKQTSHELCSEAKYGNDISKNCIGIEVYDGQDYLVSLNYKFNAPARTISYNTYLEYPLKYLEVYLEPQMAKHEKKIGRQKYANINTTGILADEITLDEGQFFDLFGQDIYICMDYKITEKDSAPKNICTRIDEFNQIDARFFPLFENNKWYLIIKYNLPYPSFFDIFIKKNTGGVITQISNQKKTLLKSSKDFGKKYSEIGDHTLKIELDQKKYPAGEYMVSFMAQINTPKGYSGNEQATFEETGKIQIRTLSQMIDLLFGHDPVIDKDSETIKQFRVSPIIELEVSKLQITASYLPEYANVLYEKTFKKPERSGDDIILDLKNPPLGDHELCIIAYYQGNPIKKCKEITITSFTLEVFPATIAEKDSSINLKYSLSDYAEDYEITVDNLPIVHREETEPKASSVYSPEHFKKKGLGKTLKGISLKLIADPNGILPLGEHVICIVIGTTKGDKKKCAKFNVTKQQAEAVEPNYACTTLLKGSNSFFDFGSLDIVLVILNLGKEKIEDVGVNKITQQAIKEFMTVKPFSEFFLKLNFYTTTIDSIGNYSKLARKACPMGDKYIFFVNVQYRSFAYYGGDAIVFLKEGQGLEEYLTIHEFGHSFCRLADEYVYTPVDDPDFFSNGQQVFDPSEKLNCFKEIDVCQNAFNSSLSSLWLETVGMPNCEKGCSYENYLRQWENSIMRDHRQTHKFNPASYKACYDILRGYS
ncbi:MAG: hypothetical protein AABW72_00075 [archaeon]